MYWALTDQQGTVRDLTDPSGNITWHGDYTSFGELKSAPPSTASRIFFGYTGKPLDVVTGLQWNNARWYDSRLGVWVSRDPIGFAAGQSSFLEYCHNDGVNKADPSGKREADDRNIREFSALINVDQKLEDMVNGVIEAMRYQVIGKRRPAERRPIDLNSMDAKDAFKLISGGHELANLVGRALGDK